MWTSSCFFYPIADVGPNYVIDFVLTGHDVETAAVMVIELNPYNEYGQKKAPGWVWRWATGSRIAIRQGHDQFESPLRSPLPFFALVCLFAPCSYFGNGTDACLFDWKADRAEIESDDFVFRVRHAITDIQVCVLMARPYGLLVSECHRRSRARARLVSCFDP